MHNLCEESVSLKHSSVQKMVFAGALEELSSFECDSNKVDDGVEESECNSITTDDDTRLSNIYKIERNLNNMYHNHATLTHKENKFIDELEDFLALALKDYDYEIFNLLFPRPNQLDEGETILDWNLKAWGTHCEPEVVSFKRLSKNTIDFLFNTAVNPPINLYKFLIDEGWTIKAMYGTSSSQMRGHFTNEEANEQKKE